MQQSNHKKHLGDHLVETPHFTDTKIKVTEVKQFVQGQKTERGMCLQTMEQWGAPRLQAKGWGEERGLQESGSGVKKDQG